MATVTLKNVPDELVQRLKAEAKQNRRSLNQEALARLEASLADRPGRPRDTVKMLRALHVRLAHVGPLTASFLDQAKKSGRT